MQKKSFFIFFGPPGSGKGTQADMIGKSLRLPVISPGELLRHERDNKTPIGKLVEKSLSEGKLVRDKIIEEILDKRLSKRDTKKGFILDGYPRRLSQLRLLKKRFKNIALTKDLIIAFYINVSDSDVKKRFSGRRVCDCGAAYHIKYNPPKKNGICDLCGKKLYKRKDDEPKIIAGRLKKFHEGIRPLINDFKDSKQFIKIDGSKNIKNVYKDIFKKIKEKS